MAIKKKTTKKKKAPTIKKAPKSSNKSKPSKQKQHTKKDYERAIKGSLGIQINVANELGLTRGAVSKYLSENPDMRELLDNERMNAVDKAEKEIFDLMEFEDSDDPVPAARVRQKSSEFVLSRLGKDRGYGDKKEIELSGNISTLTEEEKEAEIKRLLGK